MKLASINRKHLPRDQLSLNLNPNPNLNCNLIGMGREQDRIG